MADDGPVKKGMREPEPSSHPDQRMNLTIKDPQLRIIRPQDKIELARTEGMTK